MIDLKEKELLGSKLAVRPHIQSFEPRICFGSPDLEWFFYRIKGCSRSYEGRGDLTGTSER